MRIQAGPTTKSTSGGRFTPEDPSRAGEFDRFRALTERLVKVPKSEIDEARKRDKAAKA